MSYVILEQSFIVFFFFRILFAIYLAFFGFSRRPKILKVHHVWPKWMRIVSISNVFAFFNARTTRRANFEFFLANFDDISSIRLLGSKFILISTADTAGDFFILFIKWKEMIIFLHQIPGLSATKPDKCSHQSKVIDCINHSLLYLFFFLQGCNGDLQN